MWPDNETTRDLLGAEVHAQLIEAIVRDQSMLPVTIGLFGDWGGGKTSVLRMLQQRLDENESGGSDGKTACIYFNGWLLEGYDDAKSAITSTILAELAKHKTLGPKLQEGVKDLLRSVNWMRVASFAINNVAVPVGLAYATGGMSLVPAAFGLATGAATPVKEKETKEPPEIPVDQWVKDREPETLVDVRDFRKHFSKLLEDSEIERVVVLVDDLDRCSPKNIVANLEAIKLFLNVDRTAFVIAADPRIIRFAISQEYPNIDTESRAESRVMDDYLEKLIQIPYHLPRLSPSEIESYMALLFCSRTLAEDDRFISVLDAYRKHNERNRYRAFGFGEVAAVLKDKCSKHLEDELKLVAKAAPLITEGLKGNPRQVKRFLNALVLRKQLAEVAGLTGIRDDVLVKLMILEYVREKLFRDVYVWQASQDGCSAELANLEERANSRVDEQGQLEARLSEEWKSAFADRWLRMTPKLSGVDLRDYFWVARDRLASTLSDMSLISPLVRRLLDGLLSTSDAEIAQASGELRSLDAFEAGQLLDALDEHVRRVPDDEVGFRAFLQCIEADVPDAQARFADALKEAPADQIPATVGVRILSTLEAVTSVSTELNEAIEVLSRSGSRVGEAIKLERQV